VNERYRRTVELLLDIAPRVFAEPDFAMKGGTAINLFVRELPRLSVDIDLVFVPKSLPREEALAQIAAALGRVQRALERFPGVKVRAGGADGEEVKLFVDRGDYRVKVEVNTVFRGTAYPVVDHALGRAASDFFKREADVRLLDVDELYGSKLVAAMDRQHPRDLFDVRELLHAGGITPRMRRAFVIYVAGHNRPIGELLTPNPMPLEQVYRNEFVGMTQNDVPLIELDDARAEIFRSLPSSLDSDERKFLLSVKRGEPEWSLLGVTGIEHLPALQWKVRNVRDLMERNPAKHARQLATLREKLAV
jgi:predicted nucleotidyltransferase component of viral defense system